MQHARLIALAALGALAATPLAAQEDRYKLERTENGYVRLDTQTGRMSTCTEQGQQLVCRMATEDRDAYEADIGKLEQRVEALEKRLAGLEKSGVKSDLPSEEEFEQTLGYMERFFRRFMGIVTDLDRTFREKEPAEPTPDRT